MSIAVLQEKIRARKTPLALVLGPEADKLPARITKNFTDMYGPGDMAQAEALRYHGSQLISQTAPLLPAVVLQAERYLRYGFMGMDVLANLVNMAKAQGLYTIVDARTAFPAVYVEGGIRADGVTVTPYPGSDVCRVGEDKSVFAAVRTGNPSAPEIQNLLSGDRRLYLAAADQMARRGAGADGGGRLQPGREGAAQPRPQGVSAAAGLRRGKRPARLRRLWPGGADRRHRPAIRRRGRPAEGRPAAEAAGHRAVREGLS